MSDEATTAPPAEKPQPSARVPKAPPTAEELKEAARIAEEERQKKLKAKNEAFAKCSEVILALPKEDAHDVMNALRGLLGR